MTTIIGRKEEQETLWNLFHSNQAELVAVYGRRRVGKTFLIREVFKENFCFYHTGVSPLEISGKKLAQRQLIAFATSMERYGADVDKVPEDWFQAFYMLEKFLKPKLQEGRQVVFIDELPWMDTPKSGFITAFESFWNGWASGQENLMLIVCGSATSWMISNLVNSHGGLYGRVTREIQLSPFTLKETKAFFDSKGLVFSNYDIVQAYMAVGGIPFYLNYFERGKSIAQNIDSLFFASKAPLKNEFQRLFSSLFINPEKYIAVVKMLSARHKGYSRDEISQKQKLQGRALSEVLSVLQMSDFVICYQPFENGKRQLMYKLKDNFCLFYLYFCADNQINDSSFWCNNQLSPAISSWRGIAFEEICMAHVEDIKKALGVSGVTSRQSVWTLQGDEDGNGTQVDLIIERSDSVVSLCEMKFYKSEFEVDKEYDRKLRNRVELVQRYLNKTQVIHLTLVTTLGLKYNMYSGVFQKLVTIDDLMV